MVTRWYLIHTKPAGELLARDNLQRQGYRVYYPRLVKRVRAGDRWRERIVPLFSRYLFLQVDVGDQALAPVRSTVGVSGIVRFGEDYAAVPNEVIEGLRRRADPRTGLHHLEQADKRPEPYSRVRIATGPFGGLEGVFLRECGEERAVVLLSILGQSTPVAIASALVLPQARLSIPPHRSRPASHDHR